MKGEKRENGSEVEDDDGAGKRPKRDVTVKTAGLVIIPIDRHDHNCGCPLDSFDASRLAFTQVNLEVRLIQGSYV
jgi:hypothetical protein